MYLPDLSEYSYDAIGPLPGVLAVGWLASGHAFSTGDLPPPVLTKLEYLVARSPINRTRGFHVCGLCYPDLDRVKDLASLRAMLSGWPPLISTPYGEVQLGSAEVWVPGRDHQVFAAPDLIHHYITRHHYLPPGPFIAALEDFDPAQSWDPKADYERRVRGTRPAT